LCAFGVLTNGLQRAWINRLNLAHNDNAEGNQPTTDNAEGNTPTPKATNRQPITP
jgi:hypothetical protein